MMVIPKRKTSKIYMRSSNTSKSPIHSAVDLFNAIPPDFRNNKHRIVKNKLKKVQINYSLFK